MSEFQEPIHHTTAETPRWVGLAVALLGGVSLVGVGLGWSAINKTQGIQEATAASVKQSNMRQTPTRWPYSRHVQFGLS